MGWNTFRPFGGDALAVHGGEEIRHDRRWFADEVVIDFPSVAPAVERIRSAFLADERAATMTAAIQLSRRDLGAALHAVRGKRYRASASSGSRHGSGRR